MATIMMKKITTETFEAYEVSVEMEGSIEQYAMNFLKIFNTVKTEDDLLRITNDYGNGVQVVCTPDVLEETKEYLENFGKVKSVNKVLCAEIVDSISYDYDKYDEFIVVPYRD